MYHNVLTASRRVQEQDQLLQVGGTCRIFRSTQYHAIPKEGIYSILTASRPNRGQDRLLPIRGTCRIFRSTPSSALVSPGLSCYLKRLTDKNNSDLLWHAIDLLVEG